MRNCILRCSGSSAFLALNSFWVATAHCTASTTLANSASRLSPGESTTRPRCCRMSSDMTPLYASRDRTVAASSSPIRRLYPTTSALKTAVSLRLKLPSAIGHLHTHKGPRRDDNPPGGLSQPTPSERMPMAPLGRDLD